MTPEARHPLPSVTIQYLRPPDHRQTFRQPVIHRSPEVIVTFSRDIRVDAPMTLGDRVVLETGSDIVWFTFPRLWHDIGRFHDAEGVFTGLYANVLTPVEMLPGEVWRTTDLFLDVWMEPEGAAPVLLDEDELKAALAVGALDAETARRARKEAGRILERAGTGAWPPAVVREWTRERALAVLNDDR